MTTSHPVPAIAARGLRKSFGEQVVLDGIDLTVPPGTVFALLGPNGAGKTTTVHILSTLIRPDAGRGHDRRARPGPGPAGRSARAIGVTGQFSAVDNLLTGEENLLLMADLHHLGRAAGPAAGGRAARAVRPGRRGRQAGRRPTPAACGAGSTWP